MADDISEPTEISTYRLNQQIGYIMRRANQRHLAIFAEHIPTLTPTQFAAISKLYELGPLSQNELGRKTSMDAATIKGVVDRLRKRDLVESNRDENDQRRIIVNLNEQGEKSYHEFVPKAINITNETLNTLTKTEQKQLLGLLAKLT